MRVWIILMVMTWNSVQASERDLSALTKEDLEAMPAEQLNALPADTVFKSIGDPEFYDLLVRIALYNRMYAFPDSPPLFEQITAFQKDIGATQSGKLTFGEASKLMEGNIAKLPTAVYASGYAKPYIDDTLASVEGTWTIVGDDIAYPVNSSRFRRYTFMQLCFEFQAEPMRN